MLSVTDWNNLKRYMTVYIFLALDYNIWHTCYWETTNCLCRCSESSRAWYSVLKSKHCINIIGGLDDPFYVYSWTNDMVEQSLQDLKELGFQEDGCDTPADFRDQHKCAGFCTASLQQGNQPRRTEAPLPKSSTCSIHLCWKILFLLSNSASPGASS